MKKVFFQYPFLSRILLALLVGVAAIVLSSFIYQYLPIKPYFPFVGEVLLIAATALLYRTDGQSLSALGLAISWRTVAYLFGGLLMGVVAFFLVSFLRTLYTGEHWHFTSTINLMALAKSLYFILPTVIVQELMFRGYLFTKTISKWGVPRANFIFAFVFMLVHVLDRDVLQNPAQLIFLLIAIPIGHLWFATALLRSKTLLFPIGLHWGNNWAVQHLTGSADGQNTIFYLTGQQVFTTWLPYVVILLIFNVFFLLVTLATWKWHWPFAGKTTATVSK
ncbi:MAG TPA: type II CAAX endopeptidase family protein [Flavisolibacter sp.]|nr:type II CAAX endopeptidase family protein [Flavisolibacter sp.]